MRVNTIDKLFRYLPMRISRAIHNLPKEIFDSANEIRLRKNSPLSVTVGNKNLLFDEQGRVCSPAVALCATEKEIEECIYKLTEGSLYTCDRYIAQGFIPLAEGGRAGVCGRANQNGFAEITSVNLRLHRFLPHTAKPLMDFFKSQGVCGTLVCAPPALGKTTFLRSAAYLLAAGKGINPLRVGIADERCELSAGIADFGLCDVITGMPKADAIALLTRTMSPQVIVCDEISAEETKSILCAQNTGVHLIASAHCKSPKDLLLRGDMKLLLSSGIFPLCVILGYDSGNYSCKICETKEFL
ncbi:MAG: hypothetical protein E7586_05870 [Ruminococcaceae bacterium]|nr:hypothetical protein [Oscillospiraceae bacterium]